MTSSYRNARGTVIYSQEDRTVHYLRIKAQRGRSGLSQAGKRADIGQLDLCGCKKVITVLKMETLMTDFP